MWKHNFLDESYISLSSNLLFPTRILYWFSIQQHTEDMYGMGPEEKKFLVETV
jgi:hypothetical protein